MAYIRPEAYRAIKKNDLDHVVFQDPFSEVTRKAKRNVLVASFIAVLIAVLKLEVTGFLGLQASNLRLGNDIAQGLSFIVVAYFLVSFFFHAYIDYSAWNFKRERQATKPYLELISMLESHINVTCEQVNNAVDPLNHVSFEREMQAEMELDSRIKGALDQLKQINRRIGEIAEEARPLFHAWSQSIESMNRLSWRLRARIWSLWLLDIAVPICFSVLALSLAYKGLSPLAIRALS